MDQSATEAKERTPFYSTLYFRVLVAIALGVILGVLDATTAVKLRALGEGFIKLVKMTIAPLIFCTVVVGIASMIAFPQSAALAGAGGAGNKTSKPNAHEPDGRRLPPQAR